MRLFKRRGVFLVGLLAAVARVSGGEEVRLSERGWVLNAGPSAALCLEYPSLLDEAQQPTKPNGVSVVGNTASLTYPQGTQLTATRNGAAALLHFTALPAAAKGFRMSMTLPGGFKDGGKWQLKGEAAKPFPAQFGGEQFVFQGNPQPVTLTAPAGAAWSLSMPYGWQQVQDGRKWNASTFDYVFTTDMPRGSGSEAYFTFKIWPGGLDREPAEPKPEPQPAAKPAPAAREDKLSLRLTQEGLAIEAGSGGQFALNYPVFVGAKWDDVRKSIEKQVTGNSASIKFDGAARVDAVLQPAEGTLTLTPVAVPAGVKSLRVAMLIDFSYASGGSWKIGDGPVTPFPVQQPKNPHIYQGNAAALTLRNAEGAALTLTLPPSSYQQLTDNREWGWKIFAWHFDAPCQTGRRYIADGVAWHVMSVGWVSDPTIFLPVMSSPRHTSLLLRIVENREPIQRENTVGSETQPTKF